MTITRRQFLIRSAAVGTALSTLKYQALAKAAEETGLKNLYQEDFYIGTAIGITKMQEMPPDYADLITREFNAITMENNMKWELIHPEEERWDWELADKFVEFGEAHDMYMVGHVLVWHSQVPQWVFQDKEGKPLSREALLEYMQSHIHTLVGRYKGRVHLWDVVNEAVDEDKGWRKSPWFNIIGPDYMDHAFNYAHEVDPKAQLIYNDYNMHKPEKRAFVVDFVREFRKRGVPIHGIGLQGHVGLDYPDINEFEKSIEAYAAEGMRVHITEMDVDVLPAAWDYIGAEISEDFEYSDELNPYPDGLPAEVEQQLSDRYVEFFKLFLKHRDKIDRVSFWGTSDAESWKNDFPVRGRTNYPLLFDRAYQRKPSYYAVAALKKK